MKAIVVLLGVVVSGCAAVVEAPRRPASASIEPTESVGGYRIGEPLGFRVRVTVRHGDEARAAWALGVEGWKAEEVTLDDVTFVACVARPTADPAIVRMEILGRCAR